jgi:hypothetical protein
MELLADIVVNLALLLGIFLLRWCKIHKQATLAIFIIIMMIIDVIFILWRFGFMQR